MADRRERAWAGGTRVRLDAPGYGFHGARGTVAMDMLRPDAAVHVLRDGFGRGDRGIVVAASSEVARLRDQAPNIDHEADFSDFWWLRRDRSIGGIGGN